ncbi:AAA-like domain-containing protein [Argonema galeatum]|uniref:AAA-like domain-containing protein n=1 Tax=Argonema galeatum TaxID=2942762 RepID=UPI0020114239|nr:AAA-like domain-containing protein [Argonema galeatum]MCL1467147.1 AAA-like domain-containing protein [Argonema galeatum A003/A1]
MGNLLNNRYCILQSLGSGGFGETFLAEDTQMPSKRRCAIKRLKPLTQNATYQVQKRFEREAAILEALGEDCPQIPQLYAYFVEAGQFYLVQEWIEGETLKQKVQKDGPLSDRTVFDFLLKLLPVLDYVHSKGIIHRDIKPDNIILRQRDDNPVLIDFGAVKETMGTGLDPESNAISSVIIGSPGFMPPEQAVGRPVFASDLYSLGMTAAYLLTGKSPYQLETSPITGEIIWENQAANLEESGANLNPRLAAVLGRALRTHTRDRFLSASEMLEALRTAEGSNVFQLSLDNPEGQVGLESRFYVERPPIETDCYDTIVRPGALIRIKAPRQMGKSSLMTRILHHAKRSGDRTVSLNFQSADAEFLTSLDRFLQWFCASITYELNLPDRLDEYWKGVLGSKNKCTNYFQRYILSEINSSLTLALDEVDQVFQHPEIATDFFGLLRAWHERAKNDATWKKLRLVIVHSKEVYVPLNINQSPFNVGLPIELPELNLAQIQDLVKRHNLNLSAAEIEQIMAMFGGHPYLVRLALYEITRGRITLDRLLQVAPTEEGPYYDHLRRHLLNLENDANLAAAIKQVVVASNPIQIGTLEAFKLRSMGLVKFQGNNVMPLCDLYRLYFGNRLS